MRRRELITLIGGAVAWPFALLSQSSAQGRRIGVLMAGVAGDPELQARLAAFAQGSLQQSGWTVGQNLHVDYRWSSGDAENMHKSAMELVALSPDVILASSSAALSPLLKVSRNIPIVFTTVADPVGAGYVQSLARPGGNATGFTNFEYAIGGKWLELLKQIAPSVIRVAVLREAAIAAGAGQFGAVQSVAGSLGLELRPVEVQDATEIKAAIAAFAQDPNGGMIVTGSPAASAHRRIIIELAAQYQLPAVYNASFYVTDGGLISYGPDFVDQFRRAADYVSRIMKGEKPSNLPVQAPSKYELVINLKTAKLLGLTIPDTLLANADKMIE